MSACRDLGKFTLALSLCLGKPFLNLHAVSQNQATEVIDISRASAAFHCEEFMAAAGARIGDMGSTR